MTFDETAETPGRAAYAYTGGVAFDPALPVVVFVHGASNDHSLWTLPARWFAHHGHAVLAVDPPGHGRSAGPPLADVPALARWLWALLDAAGVARAALVGHSLGSLVALEAAAQAPQRATRLVLVGTAVPMQVSDALLSTAGDDPERAMRMVNAWSIASWASKPGHPGPGTWLHGANLALMRRMQRVAGAGVNLLHHDLALCRAYAGGLDAAARVACPASLIVGAADQMTPPRATQAVAAALKAPTATLACGHALPLEAPDATLAALRAALA